MDAHSSGKLHTSHLTYIVISCNHNICTFTQ